MEVAAIWISSEVKRPVHRETRSRIYFEQIAAAGYSAWVGLVFTRFTLTRSNVCHEYSEEKGSKRNDAGI